MRRYEYRTADAMLKDFALMKSNAIKFNGAFIGSVSWKIPIDMII